MDRLLRTLDELRARDAGFGVFGADRHRYVLGAPMAPDELREVERRYGVALPDDYRRFLLEVGNGGAGPGMGLERFGFLDASGTCLPSIGADADPLRGRYWGACVQQAVRGHQRPRMPFVLAEPMLPEEVFGAHARGPHMDVWADEARLDSMAHGLWPLADYGGIGAVLVLQGARRGQVWIDDLANTGAFADIVTWFAVTEEPTVAKPRDASFPSWYEHWLDTSLAEASSARRPVGSAREPSEAPPPLEQLEIALLARAEALGEGALRAERRVQTRRRRADRRPALAAASAAILALASDLKDGARVEGICPSCGAPGSLRVCGGKMVLCMPCYFAF